MAGVCKTPFSITRVWVILNSIEIQIALVYYKYVAIFYEKKALWNYLRRLLGGSKVMPSNAARDVNLKNMKA